MARVDRSKYYPRLKLAHQTLHGLFAKHQVALARSQHKEALKYYEDYASAQFKHIETEENSIFPFCEEDARDSALPSLEGFLDAHRKISESLVVLRVLLHKTVKEKDGGGNARTLQRAEAAYAKRVKVHERKEEKYFFPRIEKKLGEKKRL